MVDVKLSLGCGKKQRDGFVGLDHVDFGWNKVWNAERDQIPFGDSEVSFIEAHNFFEHIERKYWIRIFNECNRVLKPNGILEMVIPNASKDIDMAMADITHVSLWVPGCLKYLAGERPRNASYGIKPWIVIQCSDDPKDPRANFIQMRPNK